MDRQAAAITDIAAGQRHTCVLQGGEVRCWGYRAGRCGETGEEAPIVGLPPARAIFAGVDRTCATVEGGGLWCWGADWRPEAIASASGGLDLAKVVEVAAGAEIGCARDSGGGVGCWDWNGAPRPKSRLRLAEAGTRVSALAVHPHLDAWMLVADDEVRFAGGHRVTPSELPAMVDVAYADWEGCAVDVEGAVHCWQFEPTRVRRSQLLNLPPLVDVVAGDFHFCGRTRDDRLWCWGRGEDGQLGRGIEGMSARDNQPLAVPLTDVRKVSAGAAHTCALTGDGSLHCWGDNRWGQLGLGEYDRGPRRWREGIQAGGRIVAGLSTCLLDDGVLRCAGSLRERPQLQFEALSGTQRVTNAAAARGNLCAALVGGRVACWQARGSEPAAPFVVPNVSDAVDLAVNSRGGCAVGADRRVRCWGRDVFRWLGGDIHGHAHGHDDFYRDAVHCHEDDPSAWECIYAPLRPWARAMLPAPHSDGAGLVMPGIADATAVALGREHACVLREHGVVTCWGGDFGDAPRRALADALAGRKVRAIAAPHLGVCALDDGGEVVCENFSVPAKLPKIVQLSAGETHLCARGEAGEVLCWGRNAFGQLGDGECMDRDAPVRVALPGPARTIAAGTRHSCASLVDGSLWCWGDERDGGTAVDAPRLVASPARRGGPMPTGAVEPFTWPPLGPDDGLERTIDARLRQELGPAVSRDCFTLEWYRGRCGARGDLDGDGEMDVVVTIRRGTGKRVRRGLAVLWGAGGKTEFGAGQALPKMRKAGLDPAGKPLPDNARDLAWIGGWGVFTGKQPIRIDGRLGLASDTGTTAWPAAALGDVLVLADERALVVMYLGAGGWGVYEVGLPER
ncbi:hypothetical protein POL25_05780 [Nannocystis sp. bb15-2]|uniref:Uncharacterized protein n=1 Tax=Nannocystis bainbridge TaxID=2995303 RepID=A0ABT5DS18_9BACT|nr:hypothetical protein [Nannocystis bainbridge]